MKKKSLLLIWLIAFSSAVVACAGLVIQLKVLKPLGLEREEPVIALPFVLMADKTLQYQIRWEYEQMMNPPTLPPETTLPTTTPETETPTTIATDAPTEEPTESVTQPPTEPPTTLPPETEPVYVQLDESWFDDVLFIGDSRSVGLKDVGRLGQADYFCAGSMSVFTVQEWDCSDMNFTKKKLEWVLSNKTYGKIYIHLGLNEIGYEVDMIMEMYLDLIDLIQEKQPDAKIIIQAVMSMTRWKSSGKNFPMAHLVDMNERLKALAESDPELFRFSDVNSWIADEEGYLREDMTFDGCHLYGTGYMEWAQWLLEDAGWYAIP